MIKKHFKKFIKKIGNSSLLRAFVCFILILIIKITYKTGKFEYKNIENIEHFWKKNKPVIITCWHGRLMLTPYIWKGKTTINVLISPHRDGLILSGVFKKLGLNIINGSSFKSAAKSALIIKKTLENNESIAITPDGPRGPRMKLGMSPIYFAKISGAPIISISFSAKPCKILNSWDKFMFVRPFAKGIFLYGKPFYVPKDCDKETMEILRIKLEKEMITLQNNVDKIIKLEPHSPQD